MNLDLNIVLQVLQLLLAVFFGGIIGLEREYKRKQAGFQTYSLICLGSCVFTLIGLEIFNNLIYKQGVSFDLFRIIQAVAIGIGFVGAGAIFRRESGIEGITTAAGLWITAAIGIAVALKLFFLATIATLLTLIIFVGFGLIERKYF